MVGGIYYRLQVSHMNRFASRAFWLVAYPSQGHEMLFDAHTRSFAALGRIPRRGIYNMKIAVDKVKKGKGCVVNARFAVMRAHYLFDAGTGPRRGPSWPMQRRLGLGEGRCREERARQLPAHLDRRGQAALRLLRRAQRLDRRSVPIAVGRGPPPRAWPVQRGRDARARTLAPDAHAHARALRRLRREAGARFLHVPGVRGAQSLLVPCELAGQMVSTRLYPDSVVAVGHNSFAARHERPSDAGQTRYDWQYYWRKMYHKAGLVLRIETVIKNPNEFRVRKQVLRHGKQRTEWVQLRKGVVYLLRYREVSLQANPRYLDALAAVDDPTQGKQALRRLTDHREEGCRGPLLPGRQPDGATRRKSVQEPDGRPALPARLHQPRHPFTADEDALAALVRQ